MLTTRAADVPGEQKVAASVARELEDDIVRQGFPVGDVLGSEADLITRFGISRSSFREAIRILEHHGVGRMRRGPGGGLVVTAPEPSAVAAAASVWFASMGVSVSELLDALTPLFISACRLAARNLDEQGLKLLRGRVAELESTDPLDAAEFAQVDLDIASLCGNPALELFIHTVFALILSRVDGARSEFIPRIAAKDAARHLEGYRRLTEAIVQGDDAAAAAIADRMHRALRERLHDRPIRSTSQPVPAAAVPGKIAERVAASLRDEIERAGWPVGTVLGNEAELVQRYGVSRNSFREAVGILEHHRAVRMRRGPGGGIVVDRPDASSVARAAELALEYQRVTPTQLLEVRSTLEIAAVQLAAARCTPDDVATLWSFTHDDTASALSMDGFHAIHRALAEMSGSRPLALFVDVLATLTGTAALRSKVTRRDQAAVRAEVERAHTAIVAAIAAGDVSLAQHRMVRHLEATIASVRS